MVKATTLLGWLSVELHLLDVLSHRLVSDGRPEWRRCLDRQHSWVNTFLAIFSRFQLLLPFFLLLPVADGPLRRRDADFLNRLFITAALLDLRLEIQPQVVPAATVSICRRVTLLLLLLLDLWFTAMFCLPLLRLWSLIPRFGTLLNRFPFWNSVLPLIESSRLVLSLFFSPFVDLWALKSDFILNLFRLVLRPILHILCSFLLALLNHSLILFLGALCHFDRVLDQASRPRPLFGLLRSFGRLALVAATIARRARFFLDTVQDFLRLKRGVEHLQVDFPPDLARDGDHLVLNVRLRKEALLWLVAGYVPGLVML